MIKFNTHKPPIEYSYIVYKRIFAGEHPLYRRHTVSPDERISQFLEFGITDFMDLTIPGEAPEYGAMLPADIHRHVFPIRNFEAPENMQALCDIFDKLAQRLIGNPDGKLYIHCHGGVGRTGTIVACLYIYFEGQSHDEAIIRMRQQYSQSPRSEIMDAPETLRQLKFICEFADTVLKHNQDSIQTKLWIP